MVFIYSYESGVLEDPAAVPPVGIYKMTRDLQQTEDYPSTIDINFEKGNEAAYHVTRSRRRKLYSLWSHLVFPHAKAL